MSDHEENSDEKPFSIERAKQGRANCKKCKQKCLSGELRIAKIAPNPFGDGQMKLWHHIDCMFEQFLKQRPSTKRIESSDDIDGWDALSDEDKDAISGKIEEYNKLIGEKYNISISAKKPKSPKKQTTPAKVEKVSEPSISSTTLSSLDGNFEDYKFREFRRVIADITNVNSYLDKTAVVQKMFTKGPDGHGFKGDITMWTRLLLPGVVKRIYNLQSKILIKIFSKIFKTNHDEMLEHLEQGDIGETVQHFFEHSNGLQPVKKSNVSVKEVDDFLEELSRLTKQDEQTHHLTKIAKKCTANDLKIIIRLIKHDLRMNAGAKHILEGVHPDAYEAYQSCRDINVVIRRCLGSSSKTSSKTNMVKATISLMTPVLPMLAEACKSIEQAMKKCPNGMYSEIKYDGERVQLHKHGNDYKYFSRSLKPVMPHKIAYFKNYIPQAFPHGKDLILDCEILMVDTNTGKPLPFGTLGVHKKSEFKDASVCLFVFDCIYFNDEVLTHKPLLYRKQVLKENMTEIPNHVVFSEMQEIHQSSDLAAMIAKVLKLGLEGLVLKDLLSIYEPGKRHWLKVKKDYLFDGAMADSADLIVLGAWYGTGKKGGMMSVFLMGCYDQYRQKFCTVTKVHTGHDDKTLERLQKELDMVKISGDASKVPSWLKCTKTMIPDFVAKDPKNQPVWEITGAEFTQIHDVHTADGISIRFPRVTKIRDDKTWETATNLEELKVLFKNSKENTDVSMLLKNNSKFDTGLDKPSTSTEDTDRINEYDPVPNGSRTSSDSSFDTKLNNKNCSPSSSFLGALEIGRKKRKVSPNQENKRKRIKVIEDSDTDIESTDVDSTMTVEYDESIPMESLIKNPFPDYFTDVRLLLEDGAEKEHVEWIRRFVAFGGVIVKHDDWNNCNFVLHKSDSVSEPTVKCPADAQHVTVEWIKDSINHKCLQNVRPYMVKII